MPDQLQLRGGTTAEHSTFTGASKEVTVDTSKKTVVVHDGTTAGGVPLLRQDGSNSALALGSVGTPSLKWDSNTGIYSPGEDQLAISTGGSNRLHITSAGLVGIGTSSPSTRLHINDATGLSRIRLTGGAVGADNFEIGQAIVGVSNSGFSIYDVDATASRLVIDSAGNVGIGTTAPTSPLHVKSTGNGSSFASSLELSDNSVNLNTLVIQQATGITRFLATWNGTGVDTNLTFWTTASSGAQSERVRIDTSGRLLVGTSSSRNVGTSVGARLQVEHQGSSGYSGLSIVDTADTAILSLGANNGGTVCANNKHLAEISFAGNDGTDLQSKAASINAYADGTWGNDDSPGRLVFSTTADGASSPTERMRIRSDGAILARNSAGDTLNLYNAASAGASNAFIYGLHSSASAYTGTTSFIVYTNGNVVNTNGSYTTISDAKLKENIVSAGSQWDDIKAIQIRNWNFKVETGNETHRQIGPIAQEVEAICPGLVFEIPDRDQDGNETGEVTKGINQSVLYMKAVKALQEAMERIETLEAKVAALKAQ